MKQILYCLSIFLSSSSAIAQNCTSMFSYGANFEVVDFINQSSVSNAHYWWNFGDGTGSHIESPIHTFPETGTYLVTLFAKDTISNCSDYYEMWINLSKYSTNPCTPLITDSIFSYNGSNYLAIIDNSVNCGGYSVNYDAGPAGNLPPNNWIGLGVNNYSARFLGRVKYYTYDTINGIDVVREAYKTIPYNYNSNLNYSDCSANFEFTVVSENANGQQILFEAMNKNAITYQFGISGFGIPIISNADTISQWYNFNTDVLWLISLNIENANGCKDTLVQQILVRKNVGTTVDIVDLTDDDKVVLFPNPMHQQSTLTIVNPNNLSHNFTLTTSTGKIVRSINNIRSEKIVIQKGDLLPGIYFYFLWYKDNKISSGKLIIQN